MLFRGAATLSRRTGLLLPCLSLVLVWSARTCVGTSVNSAYNRQMSSSSSNQVDWSDGVFVINPYSKKEPESTVLWLHGLGDSHEGFSDLFEEIAPHMPNTRFVLPNAPIRAVTINGGMKMRAWYDIFDMIGRSTSSSSSSSSTVNEDMDGIAKSSNALQELIASERKLLGSNSANIVIGGFSQGGAMSIYSGLRTVNPPLKGIMCCSGYVLDKSSYEEKSTHAELALDTPIWAYHGLSDDVVPFNWAQSGMEILQNQGAALDLKTEARLGHSMSPSEISDVLKHLKSLLYSTHDKKTSS